MAYPTSPFIILRPYVSSTYRVFSENIYYLEPASTGITQSILQATADAAGSALGAKYLPYMGAGSTFNGVKVTYHYGAILLEAESISGAGEGAIDVDLLPDEVALEMQRRTGLAGRQHRGRIYLCCGTEAYGSDGVVLTGSATATALKALATFTGADVTWGGVVWHWRHFNRKDNVMEAVTQMRAMNVVVSQRRRRKPLIPNPIP